MRVDQTRHTAAPSRPHARLLRWSAAALLLPWALLALLPLITYPFAYGGIFLGVFTPEEAEVIMTLFLAVLPVMLVRLAIRRRPADSAA